MKKIIISLFVYNRIDHTKKLLESLSKCNNFNKCKIYIFSDNYKSGNDIDKTKVNLVRNEIIEFRNKNKNIIIKFLKKNLGLYQNLIKGISFVLKKESTVIVLEDDLVLHKNFLNFMYNSLQKFKNKQNILQISGYSYPINSRINEAYFLKLTSCWGWATWRNRWIEFIKFSKNKKKINKEYNNIYFDQNKKYLFNIYGSYNYIKMLEKQITKNYNSWGILFYLFSFSKNLLNLFPPYTLVKNNGFDGSGLHRSMSNIFNSKNVRVLNKKIIYSKQIELNVPIQKKISIFLSTELNMVNKFIKFLFK
jgi:hypothetical protein